jgi:CBS domain-containing protein
MVAAQVMATEVITVKKSTPLQEVHRVLADHRIGGVPVTDDQGKLVGVLSARDLVEHDAEETDERERGQGFYETDAEDLDEDDLAGFSLPANPETTAGEIMSSGVLAVAPTTRLCDVAAAMVRNDVHRLIVQDQGKLVGIVSAMDVLRAVAEMRSPARRGRGRPAPRRK